jgi:hypothetical protein
MWFRDENMCFMGARLEEGRWWVYLTATVGHNSWSHIVNNMLHFACIGPALEARVGPWWMLVFYFATGAGGWLFRLQLLQVQYPKESEGWKFVARYQDSIGSSPATYGLTHLLASLAPASHTSTAFALSPSALISLLYFLPMFFGEKYNIQPWHKRAKADNSKKTAAKLPFNWRCVAAAVGFFTAWRYVINPGFGWGFPDGVEAWQFWAIYVFKVAAFFKVVNRAVEGRWKTLWCPDNESHLGGVIAGSMLS